MAYPPETTPGRQRETVTTMKLKRVLAIAAVVVGGGVGAFVFREARSQWVDAGYVGILYDASRGVSPKLIEPSRVFVGWRQRLYTYPTKLQSAKYIQAADEGEVKAADGILITTSDNANTAFDVAVIYRVKPEDALKVFNNYGPVDIATIQSTHIRRAIKEAVNEIGPRYDIFELMGPKRLEFSEAATTVLQKRMAVNGITVDSVFLMGAYPTPETQEKINRRINQYTEYDIAVLRNQIAEVSRQSTVIAARAKTEATRIVGATAKDKGIAQLQLQADEEAIAKWDGRLPALRTGGNQTVIIDSDTLTTARRAAATAQAPRNENPQ
jgi:regulator of protease activity HflC (stomatin/prohibitin superfamily)